MSMLKGKGKGKGGFVIPKNKLSGSLVPILNNTEESNDRREVVQRNTRWAPDLTLHTCLKRARALAYQTRVDQITQLLNLGSAAHHLHLQLIPKLSLELERREAIGEILKLNPTFKPPSDYHPIPRQATVPIPVKAHPDYNFLALIYGSDAGTPNRLEKDTGTTIQIYGTTTETGEKLQITPSNWTQTISICEEVYVKISADTFEKVDAAADLIELLFSSVSVKPTDSQGTGSVSKDGTLVLGEDHNMASAQAFNTSMPNQETVRPATGTVLNFSQGPFYPNPSSWFPGGQSYSPSGTMPFNPSNQRPLFGPGPPAPYGFVSSSQNTVVVSPRLHPPAPPMQGSFLPPAYPLGQTGPPPRSLPVGTSPSPLVGQQSTFANSPRFPAPQLGERPLTATASSPGWAVPVSGGSQTLASHAPPAPSINPSQFPPRLGPTSAMSFVSPQSRPSSALPLQSFAPQVQVNSTNTVLRPSQISVPSPSVSPLPQSGMPRPGQGYGPSFTPLNQMGGTAPRPPPRGPGDFTFQPHLSRPPSQPLSRPGMHFSPQRPAEPPEPQMPLFRPGMQNTLQPAGHNYLRAPVQNQFSPPPGQFGSPNMNNYMGPRNHGAGPQFSNAASSLPPRLGPTPEFQQSQSRPGGIFSGDPRPGPFGRRQVHDPFLPSSLAASQPQGSNTGVSRKPEADPEYEDLMASVGVK